MNFLKTRAVCLECNINRVDNGHDFNRHREIATMYALCVSVTVRHCAPLRPKLSSCGVREINKPLDHSSQENSLAQEIFMHATHRFVE